MADLPESRPILVALLVIEMLHTIIQQSIVIDNGGATAAFGVFGAMAGILLAVCITVIITQLVCDEKECCEVREECNVHLIFSLPAQTLGAVSYFIGDNLGPLSSRYPNDAAIPIDAGAADVASTVLIGVALVIFLLAPQISHLLNEKFDKGDDNKHWYTAIDTVTLILKVDVLYSAILSMTSLSKTCSDLSVGLSSSFYILCVLLGWVYMGTVLGLSRGKDPAIKYKEWTVIAVFLIAICYLLHLLVNNSLPLDCAFGCSHIVNGTLVSTPDCNKTTTDVPCCDQVGKSGFRLGITLGVFVILSIIIPILSLTQCFKKGGRCCSCKCCLPSCGSAPASFKGFGCSDCARVIASCVAD